ncbi:MAG: HAMP domain-containing protein, partial [Chloroflexi bacterium]|nr:HAMP domain-containing protein [Chloroflexota bacterium]
SGVVALVLSVGLAYAVSRPVQQLTKAVSFLSNGDLNQRVEVRGRDELSRLGSAFNQMAESLERSEDNRRAMTADIAHELRTPLAIQRAHLEAIQDGIYPLTLENLDPVMEQNHTLAHLVEDLRTLALADAGELRMQIRPTDLKDLIQRLAARFQSRAESLNITIQTRLPQEETVFQVDPDRINQILNNLVSNALRYTPENGTIRIELGAQGQSAAVITIADSGAGIPEESLPYIFERFYRADKSRSRQEGGTGLGLAIARQLAQMHGGSLTAANAPAGGAVFTLTLPAHA